MTSKYLDSILLISLLYFTITVPVIHAQEPVPIQKSENKVIIEGKIYYLHNVKPGQTLYSISRAYGIKETDIESENPGASAGLKVGQVLKIPFQQISIKQEPVYKDTSLYIPHVLKKGETLFSLSRYYNVSLSDIEKLNPGIDPVSLKEGQIIYFPKSITKKEETEYIDHKVRRKETLYRISKKYDISVDDIKKHNPDIIHGQIKTGQILKIPKEKKTSDLHYEEDIKETIDTVSYVQKPDSVMLDTLSIYMDIEETPRKKTIDIAMLIPFNFPDTTDSLTELTDIDPERAANPQIDASALKPFSLNYLEFLEGSLIALDSMKKRGISVNLRVFDTYKSHEKVKEIITSGELNDMDLIIGPFYIFNAEIISDYAKKERIPLILPFLTSDSLLKNNPYLFQLNPSGLTELNAMTGYISQLENYNVILFYAKNDNETTRANYIKTILQYLPQFSLQDSISAIKELIYDPLEKTDLSVRLAEILSPEKKNMVIIPSANEAFVYIAVTQLFFQLKSYNIEIFGMPQWSVFQNLDLLYLHKLNLRYLTPYYFTYDDEQLQSYLKNWRREFLAEPVSLTRKGCSYAFLGYDIIWYFGNAYKKYGKRFLLHSEKYTPDLLMNPFIFQKQSLTSGFENTSLWMVNYTPDLNIKSENFVFQKILKPETIEIPEAEAEVE